MHIYCITSQIPASLAVKKQQQQHSRPKPIPHSLHLLQSNHSTHIASCTRTYSSKLTHDLDPNIHTHTHTHVHHHRRVEEAAARSVSVSVFERERERERERAMFARLPPFFAGFGVAAAAAAFMLRDDITKSYELLAKQVRE